MSNVSSRRTPYDDEYGTCAETRVSLLIYPSAELTVAEVTSRLQIQPTETSTVGEEKTNKSGRTRIAKGSLWELSSEGQVRSLDVRRHLDWLLQIVAPREVPLASIQEISGVRMAVNCAWYSRSGHGGPTLWPEQMAWLSRLNLECTFDVYFLPDER
jgi:hypothetical protein